MQGCKWRDDFRGREQPQPLEQTPVPTLNADSDEYVGDRIAKEYADDITRERQEDAPTSLPDIDGLSRIPEVPEYPAGVELR